MTGLQSEAQTGCDFDSLVERHQSMVYSFCYHFLHDRGLAEEVAQEVFLALHRNMATIQSGQHAVFWLKKVAVQRSIDAARRIKRQPQVALEHVAEPATPAAARDPLLGGMLQRLVAALPETQRSVVILRYQEDLDPSEIAEVLNIPLGTVKSHLARSLALLREKLERRGVGEA